MFTNIVLIISVKEQLDDAKSEIDRTKRELKKRKENQSLLQTELEDVKDELGTLESDETLNRGPLALLFRRQYEFPFGINIVQFYFILVVDTPKPVLIVDLQKTI